MRNSVSSHSEQRLDAILEGTWWRNRAACRGTDTNLWFDRSRRAEALTYCRSCPVMNLCLDYGLRFEREFGIWGGFTPTQRADYRPELRAYADAALRQGRWGPVSVLGSEDAFDERQHRRYPGDSGSLGGGQVGEYEGAEERLTEGE